MAVPERLRAQRERLAAKTPQEDLAWAVKLRARERRGDELTEAQMAAWREALGDPSPVPTGRRQKDLM